jgi:hypothetical protein
VGDVVFGRTEEGVIATIEGSGLRAAEHNFGLLVIDQASGAPLRLDYVQGTGKTDEDGLIRTVQQAAPDGLQNPVRIYLMVDTYPAAVGALDP